MAVSKKKKANISKVKMPEVLSFARKFDVSDGLFKSGLWSDRENGDEWKDITVVEKTIRGTKSSCGEKKKEEANVQVVDVASVKRNHDSCRVQFTCKVLGEVGAPTACSDADCLEKLENYVSKYIDRYQFTELATRYAVNLANGRFLWRNRAGAEDIQVCVQHLEKGNVVREWKFDGFAFSLNDFNISPSLENEIGELASLVEKGLKGELIILNVVAFARVGLGQEVYPSEEFVASDKSKTTVSKEGKKSKTLYSIAGVAGFHSQKIGNALRTIDTWYKNGESSRPIPIEPYGAVTTLKIAYRDGDNNFYDLFKRYILCEEESESAERDHFIIAIFIRGGVFTEANK